MDMKRLMIVAAFAIIAISVLAAASVMGSNSAQPEEHQITFSINNGEQLITMPLDGAHAAVGFDDEGVVEVWQR